MSITDYIESTITLEDAKASGPSYGIILLLSDEAPSDSPRIAKYSDTEEVKKHYATDTNTYKAAETIFSQPVKTSFIKIARKLTGDTDLKYTMGKIVFADSNWYALAPVKETKEDYILLAEWIETKRKIMLVHSSDEHIITPVPSGSTGTDIASILKERNFTRTGVFYNEEEKKEDDTIKYSSPHAAWLGKMYGQYNPGEATWAFKTLTGITATDLDSTQKKAAKDKNANIYIKVADNSITDKGVMAKGTFIDLISDSDYIQNEMEKAIFSVFLTKPKIPFDLDGLMLIESKIRAVLEEGLERKILQPLIGDENSQEYNLIMPTLDEVKEESRKDRILPDIRWKAQAAGAIHKVIMGGTIAI